VTTPTTIDDDVRLSPLASRLSPLDGFFDHPHSPRMHDDDDDDDDDDPYTPPTRDAARWRIASHRHARQTTRATAHTPVVRSVGPRTRATKPYPKSRASSRTRSCTYTHAHTHTRARTHARARDWIYETFTMERTICRDLDLDLDLDLDVDRAHR